MAKNNMLPTLMHVVNDMQNVVRMIIDEYGRDFAIEVFHSGQEAQLKPDYVDDVLISYRNEIQEFIKRPARTRPAFFRQLYNEGTLSAGQLAGFYAMVLFSMQQIKALIDLRDLYREHLSPGKAHRNMAANLSSFLVEMRLDFKENAFPGYLFNDLGLGLERVSEIRRSMVFPK